LFPPDPQLTFSTFLLDTRFTRWPTNERWNQLLLAGQDETDTEKRTAIYQELMQVWNEDPIGIYLIMPMDLYGASTQVVGFVPRIDQLVDLRYVGLNQ
jgi:ABC-type transport system substrate-binding protein